LNECFIYELLSPPTGLPYFRAMGDIRSILMKNSNPWIVQVYMSMIISRVIRATATRTATVNALEKCVNREDYWLCPQLVYDEYSFRPRVRRCLSSVSS
jgi:hypothetical protein